jgi:hypothetical protein
VLVRSSYLALLLLGLACGHPHRLASVPPVCFPARDSTCFLPVIVQDSALGVGTIRGLVYLPATSCPPGPAFARSRVTERAAHTNSRGDFVLRGLRPGPDTIEVTRFTYLPTLVPITVPSRGGIWLALALRANDHVGLSC